MVARHQCLVRRCEHTREPSCDLRLTRPTLPPLCAVALDSVLPNFSRRPRAAPAAVTRHPRRRRRRWWTGRAEMRNRGCPPPVPLKLLVLHRPASPPFPSSRTLRRRATPPAATATAKSRGLQTQEQPFRIQESGNPRVFVQNSIIFYQFRKSKVCVCVLEHPDAQKQGRSRGYGGWSWPIADFLRPSNRPAPACVDQS